MMDNNLEQFIYNQTVETENPKKVPFWLLGILCYIFTVAIAWSYGGSFVVYTITTIIGLVFSYGLFFFKSNIIDYRWKVILTVVMLATTFIGYINGNIQSPIMVNASLIMPVAIASLDINYERFTLQNIIISLVNIVIINWLILHPNPEIMNPNTVAFIIFCGISTGMIWFKYSNGIANFILSTIYLGFGTSFLFVTGCRNAGMVIVACYILLLLPENIYKSKLIFRAMYLSVMIATLFAGDLMDGVLSDASLLSEIESYTTTISQKEYGLDTHLLVLNVVKKLYAESDLFTQLFGHGVKTYHCHNLFYQCLLFYGAIGTIVVYAFYIYIFERACKLVSYYNDKITLCCFIILLGHFMLQIGEVYMLGAETVVLMSLLPAGIILQRWRTLSPQPIIAI